MNDETSPASGSRWEPVDQPDPAAQPAQHVAAPGSIPEYAVAEPGARAPWLTRARTAVAGGVAAVLIAGGLGGFAVGRATAGGEDDQGRFDQGRFDQQSGPPGFEGDDDGDRGDGGRGFDGPGPAPGQGNDSDSGGTDSQDS